jgi:hypothetical protein
MVHHDVHEDKMLTFQWLISLLVEFFSYDKENFDCILYNLVLLNIVRKVVSAAPLGQKCGTHKEYGTFLFPGNSKEITNRF